MSCQSSEDRTTAAERPWSGDVVYRRHCAMCHGVMGQTVVGGKRLRERQLTEEDIVSVVRHGKMPMPAFESQLLDEEISAVAAHVLALSSGGSS